MRKNINIAYSAVQYYNQVHGKLLNNQLFTNQFLDSEWSEKAGGFTMVFFKKNCLSCLQHFYRKECFDFNIKYLIF